MQKITWQKWQKWQKKHFALFALSALSASFATFANAIFDESAKSAESAKQNFTCRIRSDAMNIEKTHVSIDSFVSLRRETDNNDKTVRAKI